MASWFASSRQNAWFGSSRQNANSGGNSSKRSLSPGKIRRVSHQHHHHHQHHHRVFEAQNTSPHSNFQSGHARRWLVTGATIGLCLLCVCWYWICSSRSSNWWMSVWRYRWKEEERKIIVSAVPVEYEAERLQVLTEMVDRWEWRFFTPAKQLAFLQTFGAQCYDSEDSTSTSTGTSSNAVAERYQQLPFEFLKVELWKHCLLATGLAQAFVDSSQLHLLDSALLASPASTIALQLQLQHDQHPLVNSAFIVYPTESTASSSMVQLMVDTPVATWRNPRKAALLLSHAFYTHLTEQNTPITFLQASCLPLASTHTYQKTSLDHLQIKPPPHLHAQIDSSYSVVSDSASPSDHHATAYCPKESSFPCCQVTHPHDPNHVLFLLQHPLMSSLTQNTNTNTHSHTDTTSDAKFMSLVQPLQMDMPIHQHKNLQSTTPNFFQILLENDCLPTQKDCHRCLKRVTDNQSANCHDCANQCGCYCRTICKVRPPRKKVAHRVLVKPPLLRKHPDRLIPKLVHQTWFEYVTPSTYPNMSRLMESWKTSGWEYNFYDDDTIAQFLTDHFPPQVKEAYDAIIPGAFKADLFRYCLLLIRGGVYADMDVLLESNLDEIVASDVGFMTPIDEPGTLVNRRSCLWNGLIAAAPGHPFIAKTIENVVNNIRNRFTSVDYDDMLCPDPVMHVSHSVDMLFTCGPCIFGASINKVLGRHLQTQFDVGEIDIWQVERESSQNIVVKPDDPRLSIYGRSIILKQNKNDMGAHRFTWEDKNMLVAVTDMPDYDDRPPTKEHYSKAHKKSGVYGVNSLYKDNVIADELIEFVIENQPQ